MAAGTTTVRYVVITALIIVVTVLIETFIDTRIMYALSLLTA